MYNNIRNKYSSFGHIIDISIVSMCSTTHTFNSIENIFNSLIKRKEMSSLSTNSKTLIKGSLSIFYDQLCFVYSKLSYKLTTEIKNVVRS